MPSVVFYSDQPVLTIGVTQIMGAADDMNLASTCSTASALLEALAVASPELVLLDLTCDFTLDFLTSVHKAAPRTKLVLWVHFISTELALQAMGLGVRGILSKTLQATDMVSGLRKIDAGELWFEKALTDSILTARRYTLTRREGQIVTLVAQGLKNKELGVALNISEGTVKVYLSRLFKKLGLKDRFELALFGLKNLTTAYAAQGNAKGNRPAPLMQNGQDPRSFFVERQPIYGADRPRLKI
jgi:DNA-binding NarL/FixJ family response regulator